MKVRFDGLPTSTQTGNSNTTTGGGGSKPTFNDPRLEQIFIKARDNFANAEWTKTNSQINQLETQKAQKQRELDTLLVQAVVEQKAKIYTQLDGVRSDIQSKISAGAGNITSVIDRFANDAIVAVNSLIPDWLKDKLDWLDVGGLAKDAQTMLRNTIGSARNWLDEQVNSVRNQINSTVDRFNEMVKNAYVSGSEVNQSIENATNWLNGETDRLSNSLNDKIGEFKGQILGKMEWAKNIRTPDWARRLGVPDWNLYDHAIVGLANGVTSGVNYAINGAVSFFKSTITNIKPLVQSGVAVVVDAIFGDKTGNLYNEVNGINRQILQIKSEVSNTISNKVKQIENSVYQLSANILSSARKIINPLVRGLESMELAMEGVIEEMQREIDNVKNLSESIVKGVAGIAENLFIEFISTEAQKISPLEWGIEDIAVDKLQQIIQKNTNYLGEFKDRWVNQYSKDLIQAASKNNLSSLLMAGVAWNEAGGQPDYLTDRAVFLNRTCATYLKLDQFSNTPQGQVLQTIISNIPIINRLPGKPEETSFGQVQIQIRRAAEELGYDPKNLTTKNQFEILMKLENRSLNIDISAAHLSRLRKQDFPNNYSPDMSEDEIKVVATRYNRGPNTDVSLEEIKKNLSYGEKIIANRNRIQALLA